MTETVLTMSAAEKSGRALTHAGWSSRLYGIRWEEHFPLPLRASPTEEYSRSIVRTDFATAWEFLRRHADAIFHRDSAPHPFQSEEMTEARTRYYSEAGDCFLFRYGTETVGAFIGTPVDWATYYLRTCAILPAHQGKGYFSFFLRHLMAILGRHSIHRVEGDVSPGNWVELHLFNRLGFRPTGYLLSERWGALSRLTRFLAPTCEDIFLRQFCDGPRLKRREEDL